MGGAALLMFMMSGVGEVPGFDPPTMSFMSATLAIAPWRSPESLPEFIRAQGCHAAAG